MDATQVHRVHDFVFVRNGVRSRKAPRRTRRKRLRRRASVKPFFAAAFAARFRIGAKDSQRASAASHEERFFGRQARFELPGKPASFILPFPRGGRAPGATEDPTASW